MQEVQAMCDRAIIIKAGKIVADDTIRILTSTDQKRLVIELEFVEQVNKEKLLQIDGVLEVHDIKANQWKIVAQKDENMRVRLFDFAKNNNYTLIKIQQQEQNMEDVFKQLTGK